MVRARTTTGVSRQAGKAAFAAATAASRSSPVERGVRAMTSPVAGLWTSRKSEARDGTQRAADEVGKSLQRDLPGQTADGRRDYSPLSAVAV